MAAVHWHADTLERLVEIAEHVVRGAQVLEGRGVIRLKLGDSLEGARRVSDRPAV